MQKSIKVLILSLLAWDVCVGFSIAMMDMMAHRRQLNPGGTRYLIWASIMGFTVILLSYPLCRMLRGVPCVLVGIVLGLLIPPSLGWIWGRLAEPWALSQGLLWTGLDAWIAGVQLAIPSAFGGGIMGFLQSREAVVRVEERA